MVRSGEMRHQVTIQARGTPTDAGDPLSAAWVTFATRRAAIQRTTGAELDASAQRVGRVPVVFRLRYLDGVTEGMRLVFGTKVHNIISAVDQVGIGEELIITCEELPEVTP